MTIQSSFDDLERVVDEAEAFFSSHTENDDLVYKAVLLASEAVTNAIEHGNESILEKKVEIVFEERADAFIIEVEDEGEGFLRSAVGDPLAEDNLLEDGGRGLFLIERMADDVRYERGGRRTVIRFDRS
ncbi:MAG: anti-sigma regulatory factor [Bacteroidetes bacterium CG12_big_fil_rev_8_21_14_0_65_60_17]|nr:MAG: anti-sigma regulatory factor [Bacteroidetes bacterium CG12_big_fil_rev_8_21_14_0_65_60_17]